MSVRRVLLPYGMNVFENKELRTVFETKMEDVSVGYRSD